MKFNFIHAGKRFFFITLVVKGRRALLSRRVRDEIVELLPAGQRVKDHEDSRHLAEGRVLILSSFPVSVPSSPTSRVNCLAMNDRIEALCKRAGELGAKRETKQGCGGVAPEPPPGVSRSGLGAEPRNHDF